jgi:hypothetical protein
MTTVGEGPIAVDSLLSYARTDGDKVRVVLALPDDAGVSGERVFIRLQSDQSRFRVPASLEHADGRTRVEITVPREQLADGVWQLRLREAGGSLRNLGARVLLDSRQPIALLFGKTPNIT